MFLKQQKKKQLMTTKYKSGEPQRHWFQEFRLHKMSFVLHAWLEKEFTN